MDESVRQTPGFVPEILVQKSTDIQKNTSGAFLGYSLLIIALALGWAYRDQRLVNSEEGLGYWLGITGASMMLILLLYPLRKRVRMMRRMAPIRYWFQVHMILGLLGPLLILYHCNFQLGSFNSRVALFSMLIVSCSGMVGRHFYARIHLSLYDRKTSLSELQADMTASLERNSGLASIMPNLTSALEMLSEELRGDSVTQSLGIGRSLRWAGKQYFVRFKLNRIAQRELRSAAVDLAFRKKTKVYIRDCVKLMGRVAQFSFYERLFALWHLLHMPLFYLLVLSALMHVLAVHMY